MFVCSFVCSFICWCNSTFKTFIQLLSTAYTLIHLFVCWLIDWLINFLFVLFVGTLALLKHNCMTNQCALLYLHTHKIHLFVDSFVGATALYEKIVHLSWSYKKLFVNLFVCSFICATALKEHLSCSFSAALLTHIHWFVCSFICSFICLDSCIYTTFFFVQDNSQSLSRLMCSFCGYFIYLFYSSTIFFL